MHAITIVQAAVWSQTGYVGLNPGDQNRGHGNAHVVSADQAPMVIPCTTLDLFATENPSPNFIKIDVEGAESEVFRGANRVLRDIRPIILCEIHDRENEQFCVNLLNRYGYAIRWLEQTGIYPKHLLAWPQ